MNIIYHHRTMARGAEGNHIRGVIKAFMHEGHNVITVAPPGIKTLEEKETQPIDKGKVKTKGIFSLWKVVSLKLPQIFFEIMELGYNLWILPVMFFKISYYSPSLIFERNAYFLFAGALSAKLFRVPLFVEINEVVGIKRARGLKLKKTATFIEKFVLRNATCIFPVSSYLKGLIEERLPEMEKNKIIVISNAVEKETLKIKADNRVKEKYGIEGTVIGFAGWFDEWDRLDFLIDVFGDLAKSNDVKLMLVGDGPMRDELEKQAVRLHLEDKIIFTGPVPKQDMVYHIKAIDVLVLPHSNEFGSPVVLFEFMAMGKAVVVPELMPLRDVIKNGVNGMLFEPLNKEDLLEKLNYVLQNEDVRETMGKKARMAVQRKHTWNMNVKRMLTKFNKLNIG